MSWFNSSGFASLAKSALSQAQKTIDKALDIQAEKNGTTETPVVSTPPIVADDDSFFAAFGLQEAGGNDELVTTTPSASPADKPTIIKSALPKLDENVSSMWGSFTGSFFDAGASAAAAAAAAAATKNSLPESVATSSLASSSRDGTSNQDTIASQPRSKAADLAREERGRRRGERIRTRSSGSDNRRAQDAAESVVRSTGRRNSERCDPNHEFASSSEMSIGFEPGTDYGSNWLEPVKSSATSTAKEDQKHSGKELTEWTPVDLQVPPPPPPPARKLDPVAASAGSDTPATEVWVSQWGNEERWSEPGFDGLSGEARQPVSSSDLCAAGGGEMVDVGWPDNGSTGGLASSVVSAMSVSSAGSTTTVESSGGSSTMDESLGNLSSVSERDGRSSATLTPDAINSDSGESCVPIGMSSSWDMSECLRETVGSRMTTSVSASEPEPEPEPEPKTVSDLDTTLTEDDDGARSGADVGTPSPDPAAGSEADSPPPMLRLSGTSSRSDSSLVSNLLREAMAESVNLHASARANSPTSTASSSSNAERSDPVKATGESEQNSGHTSGDELETTASSDIEIISSPPSCCGDSGWERGGSQSPLKPGGLPAAWRSRARTAYPTSSHRGSSIRSDSPVSDTSSTRDGVLVPFGPIRGDHGLLLVGGDKKGKHQRKVSEGSSEDSDSNSLKCEALVKKVMELSTILEARETRMLELSRENCGLREECEKIKNQLHHTEELHAADVRDSSSLTREFTERLSSLEKKLNQTTKERDVLMRELQQSTVEVASRVSAVQVEEVKREKDTQIAELMSEGEKLQKELLVKSNNVKKLRAKEKDNENHIKHQREKIEEQSRELDRIRKAIGAKEEVEKNQIELIRQLTNTVQKYEKELSALKSDLEDVQEKQRSSQLALDNAYRELGELHRKNAAQDTLAQEAALSAEMMAKEELKATLESTEAAARLEQDLLRRRIEDQRQSLTNAEEHSSRREDMLKQEIASLQRRLQEAEAKNEDLNQNVTAATRPLLRQIDSLQSSLNQQATMWERVEGNLTEKLNEALSQVTHATEKERSMSERYAEASSKSASLDMHVSMLKQEQVKMQTTIDALTKKLQKSQESKTIELATLSMVKQTSSEELAKCKRQQQSLEHLLEVEKAALDAEKRRTAVLHEQLKEKNFRIQQLSNVDTSRHSSPSPRSSVSTLGSVNDIMYPNWYQDDVCDNGTNLNPGGNGRLNVYESLRAGSTASLLDSLQSQLKLRDGDIAQLQNDLGQIEKVKQNMTQELVGLVTQNDQLQSELASLQSQSVQFKEMEKEYNALLQMYGEKIEEAQELRLDLQDVKEMYKLQIDELLERK